MMSWKKKNYKTLSFAELLVNNPGLEHRSDIINLISIIKFSRQMVSKLLANKFSKTSGAK